MAVQNLIALLVSVTALGLTVRQHHINRCANRDSHTRALLLSLSAEYRTDAFRESEHYVLRRLTDEFPPAVGLCGLSPEALAHVYRMGHHYGDYGMLVMLPTADREHILSYVHGRVLAAWKILQPYAEAQRIAECDTESYWSYFENLAFLAANSDKRKILDRIGLRRYDGSRWTDPRPAGGTA